MIKVTVGSGKPRKRKKAKPKVKKTKPTAINRALVKSSKESAKRTAKRETVLKQLRKLGIKRTSSTVIGIGSRKRGPSRSGIARAGIRAIRGGSAAIARFINARYSAKAIAKYQDYAGRLRRSKRLIRQIVEIDANTFRIRRHIVKTSTDGLTPYSCTCPDFSQFSDDARTWLGSKAGPFNPCKHMMAVRDRLTGGGSWSCAGGVCSQTGSGPYATKAECEAALIPPPFTGGQCAGAPYTLFYNYTLREAAPPNAIAGSGSGSKSGIGPVSGISKVDDGTFTTYSVVFANGTQFAFSVGNASFIVRSDELFQSVVRLDGLPDDCGNLPSTCP